MSDPTSRILSLPAATTPVAIDALTRLALLDLARLRASLLARTDDPSVKARVVAQLDHAVAGVRAAVEAKSETAAEEDGPDAG